MKKDSFKSALFFYRKHILIYIFNCILSLFLTFNIIFGTFNFEIWEIIIYFASLLYSYIFLSKFKKVYNNYSFLNSGSSIIEKNNTKYKLIMEKAKKTKMFAVVLTLLISFPIDLLLISSIILIWALSFGIININSNGGMMFWVLISIIFILFDYFGIKQMIITYKNLYKENNRVI